MLPFKKTKTTKFQRSHRVIKKVLNTQGGITCGAIDEPRKSSKASDERVIINFCDKNVVIARFHNKKDVFYLYDKLS